MTIYRFWPPHPLKDSATKAGKPILSDLPRRMAGNLAALEGHTMGGQSVAGSENPAPVNPSGVRGHNHSGGIFGAKIERGIHCFCNDDFNTFDGTAWANNEAQLLRGDTHTAVGASSTTTGETARQPFRIWVPPCEDAGAFSSMTVVATIHISATALVAGDELRIWAENRTVARLRGGISSQTYGVAPGHTTTGDKQAETSEVSFVPGAWNSVYIYSTVVRDGTAGNRGCTFTYLDFAVG